MPLTDDLQEVAQVFAQAVRENQTVQLYLVADAALQADPEA